MQKRSTEIVVCGVPFGTTHEKDALMQLKDMGTTSIQIYTFWREFEPTSRGAFDWSIYDRQVEAIQKAGLKYLPFILMGPKYAAPSWWLEHPNHTGLRCLEHGKLSPIESIWNEKFEVEISRVLEAFANHYLPMDVLEAVMPGICGDYGEAIMPVTGNWPGDYHTHLGYWCAGEDAKNNFRIRLEEKYQGLDKLNSAWRSHYKSFDEINPFLPHRAPSRTAWFDFLQWYRGSMTDYAEFWMAECRRLFPETRVYMCTGGEEEPQHASLFSDQAKIAARHDGGIRLTNEGNRFYDNYYLTAYTWSVCKFYGADLGLEPVGPITENGVRTRIFGSAAYGNPQMFHYYGNLFGEGAQPLPGAEAFRDNIHLVKESPLPPAVAFFWPGDTFAWKMEQQLPGEIPEGLNKALAFIRRQVVCMPVNEEMILDGCLEQYKLLVIAMPAFTRREVLKKIADWVANGGTVLAAGRLLDLELEPVEEFDALFGILPTSEQTTGHVNLYVADLPDYPDFSRIGSFHSLITWMDLAPDTELLAVTQESAGYAGTRIHKVAAAFQRKSGTGMGIYYSGPVAMEEDAEAIFYDPGTFKALLKDVINLYSQVEIFNLEEGEVARARIGAELYSLGESGILKVTPQES